MQLFDTGQNEVVIDPLAIAVVLDTASRIGSKLKHCLCTLVGGVLDDGTVQITDAFANFVLTTDQPGRENSIMPEKIHHDLVWQTRQKANPRELVIGWATDSLDFATLQNISDWARTDQKNSKFIPRKRLSGPIMLIVTTPSEDKDFSITAYSKGPIANCLMRPIPIKIRQTCSSLELVGFCDVESGIISTSSINKRAESSEVGGSLELLEDLKKRLTMTLKVVDEIISGQRGADTKLGRSLYKAAMAPMDVTMDSLTKTEVQDNLLASCVTNLVKLQYTLGEKVSLMNAA